MKSSILFLLCLFFVNVVTTSLDKERDCKCRIQSKKRIINGREASPAAYPWQVSLQKKEQNQLPDFLRRLLPVKHKIGKHFCGGSIINRNWVITAAHCVIDWGFDNITVGFGENDLVKIYEKEQFADVEAYYKYPGYNDRLLFDDIALIKLKEPLNFGEAVQPACLPTAQRQDHYEGVLKISGFGMTTVSKIYKDGTRVNGEISRYLKEGETYDNSLNTRGCRKETICLRYAELGKDDIACNGDSGGPLHYTRGGRSTVIGLTSYGDMIKDKDGTTILCVGVDHFTRISNYMNWIKQTVGGDLCE